MIINKEKFIDLKLKPVLVNLVNSIEFFRESHLKNSKFFDLLKKEVEASAASFGQVSIKEETVLAFLGDDGKATKSDKELHEQLISCARDLENLRLVVRGVTWKTKLSPGIKGYGERFGAKYGLYMAPEGAAYKGVFSGLGMNLSKRFHDYHEILKIWTYLLRFLYIGVFLLIGGFSLMIVLAFTYFALYWVMVASPPVTDIAEPLEFGHFSSPMHDEVRAAIESALLQDGSFNSKINALEASLQKISSIFNLEDFANARMVSSFVEAWPNPEKHVNEVLLDSVTKMGEHLKKYFLAGDINSLELARSELKPWENKIGYGALEYAAKNMPSLLSIHARGPDGFRATYNNNVDLQVAENVLDFRQALEDGDYYLAAACYGGDMVLTSAKQYDSFLAKQEKAAQERRAADAAEAAADAAEAAQAPPPENGSGFFSSAGKNIVGGVMLGKGLSDTFMSKGLSGKNHYRCGNCGFEKMAIVSPNSCPKCKTYGKLMEL